MSIPTCAVTGAIPGDGGACGDCDPCIMGEASVPEAVKRLIAEKNSILDQVCDLQEQIVDLQQANAAMVARVGEMRDEFQAIIEHRPGTPGLSYPNLDLLIESAIHRAELGKEIAEIALASQ